MDWANQTGGLVIGTGDLSELALGWATYNGDHMSMYGVNGGIPKTLVRVLVKWVATNGEVDAEASAALLDVLDTPVSPELLPPDENGKSIRKPRIWSAPMSCTISSFIRLSASDIILQRFSSLQKSLCR